MWMVWVVAAMAGDVVVLEATDGGPDVVHAERLNVGESGRFRWVDPKGKRHVIHVDTQAQGDEVWVTPRMWRVGRKGHALGGFAMRLTPGGDGKSVFGHEGVQPWAVRIAVRHVPESTR